MVLSSLLPHGYHSFRIPQNGQNQKPFQNKVLRNAKEHKARPSRAFILSSFKTLLIDQQIRAQPLFRLWLSEKIRVQPLFFISFATARKRRLSVPFSESPSVVFFCHHEAQASWPSLQYFSVGSRVQALFPLSLSSHPQQG